MNRRLVVGVTMAVLCAAGVMSQSCEPDCTGKELYDKVPDPRDCSNYYVCGDDELPTDSPLTCEEDNLFDSVTNECVPSSAAVCDDSCTSKSCHLYCSGGGGLDFTADPNNCNQYYVCMAGGVTVGPCQCPSDRPVFNGEHCIYDPSQCCNSNDLCTPVCEPGVLQAPDPKDCHKYYICEEGVIDEDSHFTCGEGKYFNYNAGHCIPEEEPCTPLCNENTFAWGGNVIRENACTLVDGSTPSGGGGSTPGNGGKTSTTAVPADTTTSDCILSLTCPGQGYYPMCHTCQPYYFECTGSNSLGALKECSGDLVFNPNPSYPFCIFPSNCPFSP